MSTQTTPTLSVVRDPVVEAFRTRFAAARGALQGVTGKSGSALNLEIRAAVAPSFRDAAGEPTPEGWALAAEGMLAREQAKAAPATSPAMPRTKAGAFLLPPNVSIVLLECHAHGGISRTRDLVGTDPTINGGKGEKQRAYTEQIVSDVAQRKAAEQLSGMYQRAVARTLVALQRGVYMATPETMKKCREAIAEIEAQIAEHNKNARHSTAVARLTPLPLAVEIGADGIARVQVDVHTKLVELRALLRAACDTESFATAGRALAPCANLDSLTIGAVASQIRDGVRQAGAELQRLRDNAKDVKKGEAQPITGADLDLGQLQTAIELVEPAV